MTDRRRNLFVLLLVAGLLVASLAVIATKPTRLGLDLKGGVSLIYQAKPTKQSAVTGDAIDRSLDIMRKRVDQIGVAEPSLQRSGADQIDVSLPDVKNADEAASQVGTTAQMWFYDWEGSVLGPNCKPDPQNANVTGGQAAGDAQHPARAVALRRRHAGREVPAHQHRQGVLGRQVLSVDKERKKVLAGPDETRADLQKEALNKKIPFDAKQVVKVPAGRRCSSAPSSPIPRASRRRPGTCSRTSRSSAARTSRTPSRASTTGPGESGQPNVTFDFTGQGAGVWSKFTRKLAAARPGVRARRLGDAAPTSTSPSRWTTS